MTQELTFNLITLDWHRVFENSTIPHSSGIYQIYGDSPIYGMNTLLYIGQAKNLFERIVKQHQANIESFIIRQPNISYRYAELPLELLDTVEQTLIVMHKPSFNSSNIINISNEAKQERIYIQNHGERGLLHLEVTNFYFPH